MEFDSERVVPGATPPELEHEHRMRYTFAADYVRGKSVLDIACGTGYGSRMLLDGGAASVTGVDVSNDAIRFARDRFGDDRIRFLVGDAERFRDGEYDVIVSFETLEHLGDRRAFLSNLNAMLARDGRLILSTPNKAVTNPLKPPRYFSNKHHKYEYTEKELLLLLRTEGFRSVERFGQHLFPAIFGCQLFSKLTRRRKRYRDPEAAVRPLSTMVPRYFIFVTRTSQT